MHGKSEFVVFDLDGVLADFVYGFSTIANKLFDYPIIDNSQQQHWNWLVGNGYSKKEQDKIWRIVDATENWWETLPCLLDSEEKSFMKMISNRFDIIYCTNRQGDTVDSQTFRWLKTHSLPSGHIIVTKDKIKKLKFFKPAIRAVIDDRPSLLEEYHENNYRVFCRSWPYNQDISKDIPRVASIREFYAKIL